jgi:hypothetical protein
MTDSESSISDEAQQKKTRKNSGKKRTKTQTGGSSKKPKRNGKKEALVKESDVHKTGILYYNCIQHLTLQFGMILVYRFCVIRSNI